MHDIAIGEMANPIQIPILLIKGYDRDTITLNGTVGASALCRKLISDSCRIAEVQLRLSLCVTGILALKHQSYDLFHVTGA